MSFKRKKQTGRVSLSAPDPFSMGVKVKLLNNVFPHLDATVCEDVLGGLNWCVEDAKDYLSNTKVNTDDRTYIPNPRQIKEFHLSELDTEIVQNGTKLELGLLNNGVNHISQYPDVISASRPSGDSEIVKPLARSKSDSKAVEHEHKNSSIIRQDWEFVFQQMVKEGKTQYIQDLRQELENPIFAKALWSVVHYPGKPIAKLLILLRGAPGSGKSTLANLIINCFGGRVFSADHYFTDKNGKYQFDGSKLSHAHSKSQANCNLAMEHGITPIVVDNTNTTSWEMAHYAKLAVENIYFVEFLEPSTRWKKNPKALMSKTIHGVPKTKIEEMLGLFEENVTVEKLVHKVGLNFEEYSQNLQKSGYLVDLKQEMLNNPFSSMKICKHDGKSKAKNSAKNINMGIPQKAFTTSYRESSTFNTIWTPLTKNRSTKPESTNGPRVPFGNNETETPYKDVLFGCPSTTTSAANVSASFNGDLVDDTTDLFVPTDGEDWFDLQLDKNLVEELTERFGNYKPSLSETAPANLNIRIPPTLAFKLFQYYSLGLMEKQTRKEPGQTGNDDNDNDPIVKDLMEMERITSSGDTNFQKLVEIETRLWARNKKDMEEIRSKIPRSMASKLALDELNNTFPSLKRADIEIIYAMSGHSLEKSMEKLITLYPEKRKKPDLDVTGDISSEDMQNANQSPQQTAAKLREEAYKHYLRRTYYLDQIRTGAERRAKVHYVEQCNYHTLKMQEFNSKAVEVILTEFQKRHGNENDLDLHQLYVHEALLKLKEHLEDRRRHMRSKGIKKADLRVITGKGKNSPNSEPRIAPAVKNYLKAQHYSFLDCNGYILVHLRANEY